MGLLAAVGALDTDTPTTAVAGADTVTSSASGTHDAKQLAAEAADSLVGVRVASGDSARTGTGLCIGQSGSVLTSDALVGDAENVVIVANDGTETTARVRGRDPVTDLVLLDLEVDVASMSVASIAIDATTPGDDVYAVGAPSAGHDAPWVSHGVVATIDATTTRASGTSLTGLIETDAAAAESAAGGALLNRAGDVVGVVVWPATGRAGALAIPIDVALRVASELGRNGWVARAWIGVHGADRAHGVEVTKVVDDGPADRAGIRVGDVVTTLDEHSVAGMAALLTVVRDHDPGERLTITLQREGETTSREVVLGTKAPGSGHAVDDSQPAAVAP